MAQARSILIIAPNSFELFTGTTAENQFHLLTRDGSAASLARLDRLLVPTRRGPPIVERRRENPMAGYYLESFLKQRGFAAKVVFDFDRDDLMFAALEAGPLAVLFSTTFVTSCELLTHSLRRVRGLIGDLPLVVGGPFIWKQKQEMDDLRAHADARRYLAEMRAFDVDPLADNLFAGRPGPGLERTIFIGHEFGEHTLLAVLAHLERPAASEYDLLDIPNLIIPGSDAWVMTEHRPEPVDLDRDFTRWDLVDEMPRVVPLRTSVGCPFRCRFCDFIELHPDILMRSPESILSEICLALARGGTTFDFIDDNIFLTKKRVALLTETLIRAGLGIQWGGFFRADRVDAANVRALRQSGCRFGLCGIESGHDPMLRRMRKGTTAAGQLRGLELALEHGISTALTFLVGYPGETAESLAATIDFANALPLEFRAYPFYQAYPFYVLPNTAADRPEFRRQYNLRGRFARWSHDTMDSERATHEASRSLFHGIRLPYNYRGMDAPPWWTLERRNRAFLARKRLTDAFLKNRPDPDIQIYFAELSRIIMEGESGAIPAWTGVLGLRGDQPGRRLPVEKVGPFVPA